MVVEPASRIATVSHHTSMGSGELGQAGLENQPTRGQAGLQVGGGQDQYHPSPYDPIPGPYHNVVNGRPSARDLKLQIAPFEGKEIYPGLGTGFADWGSKFLREISMVEITTGVNGMKK